VLEDRVLAWVDDTTFQSTELFEALTQAADTTRLRQICLTGPSPETRRVAEALHRWWDTTFPKVPEPPKQLPTRKPTTKTRCGQPTRSGTPCGHPAGWAADTPGTGPCADHGGSTALKRAAQEHLHLQLGVLTRMAGKAVKGTPFTLVDKLDGLIALRDVAAEIETRRRRGKPV
jgi:hypothetical protein